MTTQLNSFVIETQLTTSAVQYISASSTEKKFLGKITVTNTSASDVVVHFWRLPTATTPTTGSGGNWIVKKTIPAGMTSVIYELIGHIIGPAHSLSASAATGAVINCDISGTTET